MKEKIIYGRQIEEFSKAIEEGLTVSTSFEDAFETVKIIDALYKSSKKRKQCIYNRRD